MRSTFSLLGTIKCSTCGLDVDIAELGDHVCAPQKEEEPILLQKKSTPASQDSTRQGKHALPPIDPNAANRPFLGRDEATPRSSSSGSQDISPATPVDGQPLLGQSDRLQLKESASSSVYTTGTPADPEISPQHLFAPPPNDTLYAPVSPTVNAGSSLMAKLTSIAPGPFALNASSPQPLSSPYGERPSSSKGKLADSSPDITSRNEKAEKEWQREEAERKLSGATELQTSEGKDNASDRATPAVDSNQSNQPKNPGSSGSATSNPPKSRPDNLKLSPNIKGGNEQSNAASPAPEKPLPSPSYQAYRPPQPPQRIPRSPTFPDRPRTPAGYGPRLQGAQRLPVGLPSSPAHNLQKSNTSPNSKPGLPPQLYGPRRPSAEDRLIPNSNDRSNSRPGTRDGDRENPDGRPKNEPDLQESLKDFSPTSPGNDEAESRSPVVPPSPLRPTTPKTASEQSGKQGSPNKKGAVKSNCRGCGEAIKGKGLTSSDGRLTGRYHKECFVCQTCREPFATSTFYVWEDLPYCSRHYHVLNNSLCKSCDLGIEGHCLETERSDRFHPHCFTCMDCRRVLGDDYFEIGGRPYCERDAHRVMQQQRARAGPGRNMPMGRMERRKTRMMMM